MYEKWNVVAVAKVEATILVADQITHKFWSKLLVAKVAVRVRIDTKNWDKIYNRICLSARFCENNNIVMIILTKNERKYGIDHILKK